MAPFRFLTCTRADLRRGGAAMVLLTLIAGLAGGITLASIAGARRTSSSYDRLLEAEGAPEVSLFAQDELSVRDLRQMRAIPRARVSVSTVILLSSSATGVDRRHDLGIIAAADDESLALLRPQHLKGRMPSPEHPEEVVVNELVADQLDLRPGDHFDVVGPGPAAFECAEEGRCAGELMNDPVEVVVSGVMRLAGDLDPDAFNGALMYAGPGMNDLMPPEYARPVTVVQAKLDDGRAGADAFAAEVERRFPERFGVEVDDPSDRNITSALQVESRSLVILALFVGLAGMVAASQAFARHLAAGADERRVLAALGLTVRERAVVTLRSGVVVVAAATAFAAGVATIGSTFLPVGLARLAEPDPGIEVDGTVLGVGSAVMAVWLAVVFAALSWWAAARDTGAGHRARSP
ncbi:MAG: hypothetical protein ACRDZU_04225, partial [Acidimicrobiales bacterium]